MATVEEILEGLNEEQLKAATSIDGAYRLIAGAGSGKTFTLKKRVAYICKTKGIEPKRVLSLTFTNKAAAEMRKRVALELNVSEDVLVMKTFHSLSVDIVKRDCEKVFGWKTFSIGDNKASVLVPKFFNEHSELLQGLSDEEVKELKKYILSKVYLALNSDYYVEFLDKKNHLLPLADTKSVMEYMVADVKASNAYNNCKNNIKKATDSSKIKDYISKYESLQMEKHPDKITPPGTWVRSIIKNGKKGICSFDDLIKCATYMLENFEEIRNYWSNQFDYIQVDEFQDTDSMQLRIVQALYQRHGNLFVVGDPDQSIYLFRGAEPSLFNDLDNYVPNLHTIFMQKNYRSTAEIVNISNNVIELNKNRIPKTCNSESGSGEQVQLLVGTEDFPLALQETAIIKDLLSQKVKPEDIAILYRSTKDKTTDDVQQRLRQAGIPVCSTFKESEHAGIGFTREFCKYYFTKDEHFLSTAAGVLDDSTSANGVKYIDIDVIKQLTLDSKSIYDFLDSVYKSYKVVKGSTEPTAEYSRFLNAKSLSDDIASVITDWLSLSDEEKLAQCDTCSLGDYSDELVENGVNVLTMHKSKGLEYKYVFVNGLTKSIMNSNSDTVDACDEQARLVYVAYSRAKAKLYICCDDVNDMHGTMAKVIDADEVQQKQELLPYKADALQEYFDRLDTKSHIIYVPLQYKDTIRGYRCVYTINGEKIAYQATIEDLTRLNCVPKKQKFLVTVTDPLQIYKINGNDFICFDEKNKAMRRVTLTKDADIIAVFGGSCKEFVKDIKDKAVLCSIAKQYFAKAPKKVVETPKVEAPKVEQKKVEIPNVDDAFKKVCTYEQFVELVHKKRGRKATIDHIADGKIFVEEVATKKTIATSYEEFFKYIGNGAFYVTNPSKLHQYNLWL